MAFKGLVRASCPKGCEPSEVEIWSFIRGDVDLELRESLLAGELNLILCETCGQAFYPESVVVYFDPKAELLAFIMPESYRAEEGRWRKKMQEDYLRMRQSLAAGSPLDCEPLLFFGIEPMRELLRSDEDLADEVRVARHLCGQLQLRLYAVDRAFARSRQLPWAVPSAGKNGFSRASVREGLQALLKANDRLGGYRRWAEFLEASQHLPPLSARGAA